MTIRTSHVIFGLGLAAVLIVAGSYLPLRTHADADEHTNETSGASTNDSPSKPSLPMKRLEGADQAEILEAIKNHQTQQLEKLDDTGNVDETHSGPAEEKE